MGRRAKVFGLLAVFTLSSLVSCTSLKLTDSYDPQIEKVVNDYHEKVVAFVTKMELNVGLQEGEFSNSDVIDFYARSQGQLTNLVVRAEAVSTVNSCTPGKLLTSAIPQFVTSVNEQTSIAGLQVDSIDLNSGSCTVVVLKSLLADQLALQAAHKKNKFLRPPLSTLHLGLIEDGTRLALQNEQAKK